MFVLDEINDLQSYRSKQRTRSSTFRLEQHSSTQALVEMLTSPLSFGMKFDTPDTPVAVRVLNPTAHIQGE